ncbi:cob(I)yrinic acid a,c-diamide adenosyltransferase [Acetivibrio cellulolyticus]|uniref:cob(I)yrinic acid a,c-diamide adenosyltransferase n=1 Tax=Acetivibrio cellulolyticus TaxID=35830 RepID=UPI0001E3054F|nr:cob(I)yrinic acid a,c-diamide adenosyltransferase [Acetivibrio cellulolyticus]
MDKGLVQVYTGEGKGKTTAAIGQGIRAYGRGKIVYMLQFLKSSETGELMALKKFEPGFKVFRFEKQRGFVWNLGKEEIEELKGEIAKAFDFVRNTFKEKSCDVLILDEIMGVLGNGLIDIDFVLDVIKGKPEQVELILTGRNVPAEIIEVADYVSQIACIKHPFEKGIPAREGIEF